MRTASEMYQYCLDNHFGQGQNRKWGEKHFALIEQALDAGEDVLMCFIGLHNYVSATKHDSNYAYAITSKRIIMAQKKLIGEALQTVALDHVNDITFKSGLAFGIVTIDTMKEKFNVAIDKTQAKNVSDKLHTLLIELKNQSSPVSTPANSSSNDYDQLIKLKQLLDAGILTQEEFDAKKKQILGL